MLLYAYNNEAITVIYQGSGHKCHLQMTLWVLLKGMPPLPLCPFHHKTTELEREFKKGDGRGHEYDRSTLYKWAKMSL
jgi:hypothetical protein